MQRLQSSLDTETLKVMFAAENEHGENVNVPSFRHSHLMNSLRNNPIMIA